MHGLKELCKHRLFLTGFIFLFLLISFSLIHAIFFHDKIPVTKLFYDSKGEIIASGPFSPIDVPPFGTDPIGRHIFFLLIQGAKYTIGIAVVVAAMRIMISSFVGLIFGGYLSKWSKYISGLLNGFYYIPVALICYVLLYDVVFTPFGAEEQYSFWQKAVFELIILTIVAIPTTSLLIGNQIKQVYREEFISSAKTLGGSRFFILKKHVLPHMKPRILIQFTQEIVQVLILLIHLGFFRILFGGTSELGYDPSQKVYISLSSEWSGMVGEGFGHLNGWWWTFFGPAIAFLLTILALKFTIKGMEDVFLADGLMTKKRAKGFAEEKAPQAEPEDLDFSFVKNGEKHG